MKLQSEVQGVSRREDKSPRICSPMTVPHLMQCTRLERKLPCKHKGLDPREGRKGKLVLLRGAHSAFFSSWDETHMRGRKHRPAKPVLSMKEQPREGQTNEKPNWNNWCHAIEASSRSRKGYFPGIQCVGWARRGFKYCAISWSTWGAAKHLRQPSNVLWV